MKKPSAAEVYLSKWSKSSDTYGTMYAALNALAKVLDSEQDADSYPWHDLRYDDVRAIPAKLADAGRAPATINKYLSALRGVLETAWRSGKLPDEEYRKIKVKSVPGKRLASGRALDDDDVAALAEGLKTVSERDAALISYLLIFGLRRVEVYRDSGSYLKREDYDPEVATIIAKGKGDKERAIPAAEEWIGAITKWWKTLSPGTPMFADDDGEPLTRRQISYCVERFCKKVAMRKFTPHDLRRTFATGLLRNGADLLAVKDLMGHESLDTTSIYDRRGDEAKRKAVNTIRRPK